uniref:C-type lectin domain-containing protein n=1 Tax=Pundamilia nyererei TaxID=303518 RepID=A0A3B4G4L2_9CICH
YMFLYSHLVKRCIYCPDGWNQARCPYGWTQVGSRCFTYNQTPMSWDSAKRHCWGLGANLASVHTYWEHQRIMQLFGNTPVWIGGISSFQNGAGESPVMVTMRTVCR